MPRKKRTKPGRTESPTPVARAAEGVPELRLEWRSPAELAENPRNWRTHPEAQLAALTDVVAEVGWAGACLFNERTGRLIDGHARRKVALAQGAPLVPVLIGSWSEEQEAKILATLDPLAGMAKADPEKLEALLRDVQTGSQAVASMLSDLAAANGVVPPEDGDGAGAGAGAGGLPEKFEVLVQCETEAQQAELLERLDGEGYKCRSLIS